jgi:Protein of unknown function (DUF992)
MKSKCTASISMRMIALKCVGLAALIAVAPLGAKAQNSTQVGTLSCDVSAGLGLFVVEKQKLTCVFTQDSGVENYTGSIDQFGVALGEVQAGHLVWGVLAATQGLPKGALDGSYAGVGANASLGVGAGANVLVGGSDRTLSLQPISVEGQTGINIAGGVTTVKLTEAP